MGIHYLVSYKSSFLYKIQSCGDGRLFLVVKLELLVVGRLGILCAAAFHLRGSDEDVPLRDHSRVEKICKTHIFGPTHCFP